MNAIKIKHNYRIYPPQWKHEMELMILYLFYSDPTYGPDEVMTGRKECQEYKNVDEGMRAGEGDNSNNTNKQEI